MSQHSTLSLGQRLVRSTGLQLILVAGSFSLLTYTLGRNSGIQESEVHRTNLSVTEIREQLSGKLRVPMFLNDLNASAIDAQPDLLKNFDALGRRFWHQLKAFPVDYINYGAPDGSFLGLERGSDDDVLLYEDSTRLGRGQLTVFSLSAGGERLEPTEIIPGMSATHEEAWYVDTVTAGRSSWSLLFWLKKVLSFGRFLFQFWSFFSKVLVQPNDAPGVQSALQAQDVVQQGSAQANALVDRN